MALFKSHSFLKGIKVSLRQIAPKGLWSGVEMGPPDPIFGISEAFKKDKDKNKVNVGVGAYRSDEGKPYVLKVVREAEKRILKQKVNHEYAPLGGAPELAQVSVELAFGADHPVVKDGRYATVQTVAGTGSLRLGAEFIAAFHDQKCIFMPEPTWGNHGAIFKAAGFKLMKYKYYDKKKIAFDFKGCVKDLCKLPEGSVILVHACAHNPTGIDPTKKQWDDLAAVVKEKKLVVHMDMAYQGFASGDFEKDAYAVRKFAKEGIELLLSQSFSKNMGLYGERIGALTVVVDSKETAAKVMSRLKLLIRGMYSNPPLFGQRIVTEILCDEELKSQWIEEVKCMAERIICARQMLRENLEKVGSKRKWNHITDQIGMFCYTGLKPKEVEQLTKKFHIYLTKDGRISMAGVTSKNAEYVAKAIHSVTKGSSKSKSKSKSKCK